jgi:hypothetical protein
MILYALSTNCNKLVEETFPAPKSQKNKWEADFVNINFTRAMQSVAYPLAYKFDPGPWPLTYDLENQ